MTRLGDLNPGATFRAPGHSRRWRVFDSSCCCDDGVTRDRSVQAQALDAPERRGSARGMPGGTNEVEQGETDWWSSDCNVEVVE